MDVVLLKDVEYSFIPELVSGSFYIKLSNLKGGIDYRRKVTLIHDHLKQLNK